MRGKIIVIEGTDCSGKETQSKRLIERLKDSGIKAIYFCYPNYDTPTGKIIGGPYLGKASICEGWFKEGATNVDGLVASLYYAADRLYNQPQIEKYLNEGYVIIIDRYVYSNMAHQGSKYKNKEQRYNIYNTLEKLEYEITGLLKADIRLFLHVPFEYSKKLNESREEMDEHERNDSYMISAYNSYLEVAEKFDFKTIECIRDEKLLDICTISDLIYDYVVESL